ncbi:hypothetical protein TBLA_0D04730 [Henningerozyma blattae CBS 6284]|uniref:F-actin-capping protein subunit beta n=1 Tax=Henningerozyma blattae (strain ATCC 34711 / CBS 6284 / DSM 70876 / NBRC 10599 / NRRL Y-10934 / UCD 77-7) TaxID=1071380 RepID=I2H3L7_HENB6|nr:hypothetical protein TBLA_0D04730 [Tetrapisispora blattae CBS 6284]CCH60969.1 hypothetical protein TBLA_0D04730 [Tetrapisispora blattae CBS 6284]
MSEIKLDAALDLLGRLNANELSRNLNNLISLEPSIAEDLLSSIDLPLKVQQDNNREYLCCDYNRDIDSYRSPWSNEYLPKLSAEEVAESPFPSDKLREFEIIFNDSIDIYKDLYYEGGISSAYFWDNEDGDYEDKGELSGVVLFKKKQDSENCWDSIHVVEVLKDGQEYSYRVTTTIILNLQNNNAEITKAMNLSGNLTKQHEKSVKFNGDDKLNNFHIVNLGSLIEDIEIKMRTMLEVVYFEKTRDIFHEIKNSIPMGRNNETHKELIDDLQKL